jgi:hypothetical protein
LAGFLYLAVARYCCGQYQTTTSSSINNQRINQHAFDIEAAIRRNVDNDSSQENATAAQNQTSTTVAAPTTSDHSRRAFNRSASSPVAIGSSKSSGKQSTKNVRLPTATVEMKTTITSTTAAQAASASSLSSSSAVTQPILETSSQIAPPSPLLTEVKNDRDDGKTGRMVRKFSDPDLPVTV